MTDTDSEIINELKHEAAADLRRLQKMPYEWKLKHSAEVIIEFADHLGVDNTYVAFSGGRDSTVLLHLVRSIYPNVPAVFANTGIEFPEQVAFVRQFSNVTVVHPIKRFPKIIKEHGIVYPSKEVAMYIRDALERQSPYAIMGLMGKSKDGTPSRYKSRFKKWAFLMDTDVKMLKLILQEP